MSKESFERFYIPQDEFSKASGEKPVNTEDMEKFRSGVKNLMDENEKRPAQNLPFLKDIKLEELTEEDMVVNDKVMKGNFNPEEFKEYQMKIIAEKNNSRIAFMRSLMELARENLDKKDK